MSAVRPAAVAGMFYPGDPKALAADVDDLLGGVESLAPRLDLPKALIVPHAGYIYSGGVAAHAYDELAAARGEIRRVVLLGPVHRVAVRGLAVPGAESFATPLGRVRIDREALRAVSDLPQVVASDRAHALEHSLEVQLPFLQTRSAISRWCRSRSAMRARTKSRQVIERLWGGAETLIVISTDLSHYRAYDAARAHRWRDRRAHRGALRVDLNHEQACGATPVNGFLAVARRRELPLKLARGLQLRRHRRRQGPGGGLRRLRRSTRAAARRCARPGMRCWPSHAARSTKELLDKPGPAFDLAPG